MKKVIPGPCIPNVWHLLKNGLNEKILCGLVLQKAFITSGAAPLAEFEFPAKVISSYLRSWADQWHENGGRLSWRSIKQVGTSTTHHHAPPGKI